MMKMQHILLVIAALAFIWLLALQFAEQKKRENFMMQLYRPTPVVSVPEGTWDIADTLTQSLPSKDGPKLVVQKGNYRRFNRV
jgi:ABC-type uncharacterized transport system auxiliary subunit